MMVQKASEKPGPGAKIKDCFKKVMEELMTGHDRRFKIGGSKKGF
jgi:hypothetical protein